MHFLYPTHFSRKTVLAALLSAIFLHILVAAALFFLAPPKIVTPPKTVLHINFIQSQSEPSPEPADIPQPVAEPTLPEPIKPTPPKPTPAKPTPPKTQPEVQKVKPIVEPVPVKSAVAPITPPVPKVLTQTQTPSAFAVQQAEQQRQEQLRQEQLKQEQARQEQLKQEQLRQEQARQEQLRQEQAAKEQAAKEAKEQAAMQQKAAAAQAAQAQKEAAPLSVVVSAASWRVKPNLHFSAEEAAEFNPKATAIQASFWFDEKGKISQISISSTGDSRLDRQIKTRLARASLHPQKQNGVARAGQATATLEIGLN